MAKKEDNALLAILLGVGAVALGGSALSGGDQPPAPPDKPPPSGGNKLLYAIEHTQALSTTLAPIVGPNPRRRWIAFVNEGTMDVYLYLLTGSARITLGNHQAAVMSMTGDMPWQGEVSALASSGTPTLACVEVEER